MMTRRNLFGYQFNAWLQLIKLLLLFSLTPSQAYRDRHGDINHDDQINFLGPNLQLMSGSLLSFRVKFNLKFTSHWQGWPGADLIQVMQWPGGHGHGAT